MRCACIDIGSNTTRLLVAEPGADGEPLRDVAADRVFTRLAAGRAPDGSIAPERMAAVAEVVAAQVELAYGAGAGVLAAVATAAVRDAPNAAEVCAAVTERAGVHVRVIGAGEEAGLAFRGAVGTLRTPPGPHDRVGVVDVGGGSTELVSGTTGGGVGWARSFPIGSGVLTDRHVTGDRPRWWELEALRADVVRAFGQVVPPPGGVAFAVGGSATSLGRLTGGDLHAASLARALDALCAADVEQVARRFGLHPERVRMLPAGIIVLDEAARAFDVALRVAAGGLREGVILRMLAEAAG